MNYAFLKILLIILGGIALVGSSMKIMKEYERAVVFRLGKLLGTKGPGLIFLIPLFDRIKTVDLRLVSIDVPRQDIMTRDNVPVTVDAVVYFQITDPSCAVITIQDIYQSTFLIAQATLRNVLGQVELDDLLSQQTKINEQLEKIISVHTKQWGIRISIVEIKEVTLPEQMKRAMAKQAETERERRARLIDAQAEYQASRTLADAGRILAQNPQGLQLRYLQTLRDISSNKGSTILFPMPLNLLSPFLDRVGEVFKTARGTQPSEAESIPAGRSASTPAVEPLTEKHKSATPVAEPFPVNERPAATPAEPLFAQTKTAPQAAVPQGDLTEQSLIERYTKRTAEGGVVPRFVQWVLTDRCQFQCPHCDTAAGGPQEGELTTEQAHKVVDDLAAMGCEFLSLTGGEPMLREDFFAVACYAKEKGLPLGLTTNAQAVEEHLAALADLKLDSVVVTLDGYGDVQNRIRNAHDSYERGIRGIEFFHDIGVPRICVSTILVEESLAGLPRLTEDVFRSGANLMQVQPQVYLNGRPERNTPEVVKGAFKFILGARTRGFPVEAGEQFGFLGPLEQILRPSPFFCGCGWNTFCITNNGTIQGCQALSRTDIREGNCTQDTLSIIWQEGFTSFRKETPESLPEGCRRCPHLSVCRGGCWILRVYGLNPCFLLEAEQVHREITDAAALYPQTP
ncbi:MAG: SPFH domain-containing protein [bacterium]